MSKEEIFSIFKEKEALREGHFELSSGLHSAEYVQSALVLQYPLYADRLCRSLSCYFKDEDVQVVISPAIGGIIVGQKVAEILGARAIFAEREKGKLTLRRGFSISPGERILIVEDVITTGSSIREITELVEDRGGRAVGMGCLVDRSGKGTSFTVKGENPGERRVTQLRSLLSLYLRAYVKEECPLCKRGLPLIKPGSRKRSISD